MKDGLDLSSDSEDGAETFTNSVSQLRKNLIEAGMPGGAVEPEVETWVQLRAMVASPRSDLSRNDTWVKDATYGKMTGK